MAANPLFCIRQCAWLTWPNWFSLEGHDTIQPAPGRAPEENTWGLEPLNLYLNVNVHAEKNQRRRWWSFYTITDGIPLLGTLETELGIHLHPEVIPADFSLLWRTSSSWEMCCWRGSSPYLPLKLRCYLLWTPGGVGGQPSADHCLREELTWAALRSKPRPKHFYISSFLELRLACWTPCFCCYH